MGNCHMETCEWQRGERWKGNGASVRGNGEWGDSGCNGEHGRDNGETGMGETWEAQRGSGILIFMSPVAGAIPTSREHAAAGKQADIQTPARQGPYKLCGQCSSAAEFTFKIELYNSVLQNKRVRIILGVGVGVGCRRRLCTRSCRVGVAVVDDVAVVVAILVVAEVVVVVVVVEVGVVVVVVEVVGVDVVTCNHHIWVDDAVAVHERDGWVVIVGVIAKRVGHVVVVAIKWDGGVGFERVVVVGVVEVVGVVKLRGVDVATLGVIPVSPEEDVKWPEQLAHADTHRTNRLNAWRQNGLEPDMLIE